MRGKSESLHGLCVGTRNWREKGLKMKIWKILNMSAHVLLTLLNELRKRDKCEACRAFYLVFATS